jgi:hypothetical protein
VRKSAVMIIVAAIMGLSPGAWGAYHHMGEKDAPKFQQAYPDKVGSKLDDCSLCHKGNTYKAKSGNMVTESVCQYCHGAYGYDGKGDINTTLNTFGMDYRAAGRSAGAFPAIEKKDSDNDTYSNIAEINAVRYPGDKLDTPAKVQAPHIVLSLDELKSILTPHEQFMLMNNSRGGETGFDYYVTYTGFIMQDLLAAAGMRSGATGVTVMAPDGFCYSFDRASKGANFFIEGAYPQARYFYDPVADKANGGWVDYSAPGCTGRKNGQIITVDNDLHLLLAYKANGAYLDTSIQGAQNKLAGEGPFRVVPPQLKPGYPDRKAVETNPGAEPWPYDANEKFTDHNAGFSARGVAAIRIDPLPAGTTEYDWRNNQTDAGWSFLRDKKIVIFGNMRSSTIKGRVNDMSTQAPLARALVSTDKGGYLTLTDEKGSFILPGIVTGPAGKEISYSLMASARGHIRKSVQVKLGDGDTTTINFTLLPGSDN